MVPSWLTIAAASNVPLLTSFTSNTTVRSASPYGPLYSTGFEAYDTDGGRLVRNQTMFPASGEEGQTFYLRLCAQSRSFFINTNGTCTAKVSDMGCTCVVWNPDSSCGGWAPFVFPSVLPDEAQLSRSNVSLDGTQTDEYQWNLPPFGPVIAYVSLGSPQYVVRFVASRVQTDYRSVKPGPPPSVAFEVPAACHRAELALKNSLTDTKFA